MAIQIFDEFLKEFEQPITEFVSNSVQNLGRTSCLRLAQVSEIA
jgi:hypothetical protein